MPRHYRRFCREKMRGKKSRGSGQRSPRGRELPLRLLQARHRRHHGAPGGRHRCELAEGEREHKYPMEEMKQDLAEELGLTKKQISGWFCHKRLKDKRLLKDEAFAPIPSCHER
ncbi:uncharacterized protein DS421_2g46870 [Arachis hypogaea]|nr:segmentation polarity homeobox protein engrailed [Arachis hypogaea]QHO53317.1 uncharacterized protein DS421_2g46870 [Arachis hypogaea]